MVYEQRIISIAYRVCCSRIFCVFICPAIKQASEALIYLILFPLSIFISMSDRRDGRDIKLPGKTETISASWPKHAIIHELHVLPRAQTDHYGSYRVRSKESGKHLDICKLNTLKGKRGGFVPKDVLHFHFLFLRSYLLFFRDIGHYGFMAENGTFEQRNEIYEIHDFKDTTHTLLHTRLTNEFLTKHASSELDEGVIYWRKYRARR